jgi:transcriptional regulator with XRE-family HTH domain
MKDSGKKTSSRLWKHRNRLGLKQIDIARKLGLSDTAMISRWEQGVSMPSLEYVLKLSIIYQTLVNELYHDLLMEYQKELFPDKEQEK